MFELDSEAIQDFAANRVAQCNDIACRSVATLDARERVAGGDSRAAHGEARGKPCFFKQPSCGKLDEAIRGRPMGNLTSGNLQAGRDLREHGWSNNGIFEEGTRAAAVGFAIDDQHALAMTDGTDGVIDVKRCWRSFRAPIGEVALEVGIGEVGPGCRIETEGNGSDDVAIAAGGVEDAPAIGKIALIVREVHKGVRFQIEGADAGNGAGYLLPVGSDVLYRGAADGAGNSGEAFDAADSAFADVEDKGIPFGSGADGVVDGRAVGGCRDGVVDCDVDDQAVEARIADEQVAATPKDKDFEVILAGIENGVKEFGFAGNLAEKASRAADAKGGVGGEGYLFPNADGGSLHGFEGTTPAAPDWRREEQDRTIHIRRLFSRLKERLMYPEIMVIPMREELTRAGVAEARSAAEVDAAVAQKGTTMVVVNSICGCAAGKMRPGVRLALQHGTKPDHAVAVFAGQDVEATEKARTYFGGHPPTSPAIAILRDGQLVYLMQRSAIETSTAPAIAQELTRAFDTYCASTTA